MMFRTTAAAAAAFVSLALAGAAAAAQPIVTVKLETPVAERAQLVAGGAVFVCQDGEGGANAPTSRTFAASTCKDVAKKFGAVTAFERGVKPFAAEQLSACNASALPKTQVANR